MSNRPKIPADTKRKVLNEAGHQCAVDGKRPVHIAHIEPFNKSREHNAENLIALCPNCHAYADEGKLSKKTLISYKKTPYIKRVKYPIDPTLKIKLIIDDLPQFDERFQRILPYAIAGFLNISPDDIRIISTEKGV